MGCGWVRVLMVAVGVDGLWLGSGFVGCRGYCWVVVGFGLWLPVWLWLWVWLLV